GAAEALRGRGISLAELPDQLGLLFGGHADACVGDGKLDEAALYECIDKCIASPLSKIVARQTYICRMLEAAVQAAVQATKISATSHGASARSSDGNPCIRRPLPLSPPP